MSNSLTKNSLGRRAWRRLIAQKSVVLGMTIIAVYIAIAILGAAGFLPDYQERVGEPNLAPELTFTLLVGTDIFGRSVFYKILAGTTTAMPIPTSGSWSPRLPTEARSGGAPARSCRQRSS